VVTWVVERGVFGPDGSDVLEEAAALAGHAVVPWSDLWKNGAPLPRLSGPVVFRGCLETAAWVRKHAGWVPGSYCAEDRFRCTSWYPAAKQYLLHESSWRSCTARQLVEDPDQVLQFLGCPETFFVRPDSALKPFSGRVLRRDKLSWEALDYGFYYEDRDLPVIVARTRPISREFRFVVTRSPQPEGMLPAWTAVGGQYDLGTRRITPHAAPAPGEAFSLEKHFDEALWFAMGAAAALPAPVDVYVMDVCESEGQMKVLEVNPFSGAELAGIDAGRVVFEVDSAANRAIASRDVTQHWRLRQYSTSRCTPAFPVRPQRSSTTAEGLTSTPLSVSGRPASSCRGIRYSSDSRAMAAEMDSRLRAGMGEGSSTDMVGAARMPGETRCGVACCDGRNTTVSRTALSCSVVPDSLFRLAQDLSLLATVARCVSAPFPARGGMRVSYANGLRTRIASQLPRV
jgi:hypothetical protein